MAERSAGEVVTFVMVGGFLGAGKTTTLCLLGEHLAQAGERVALVVNDKAEDLVDAATARLHGLPVRELAGGCFCCRFQAFVDHCNQILDELQPTVLMAEPVGSSADLAAAVLQPLQQYYGEGLRTVPYSVLLDPARAAELLEGRLAESPLGYLFGRQLEEADVIVVNKIDRLTLDEKAELLQRLSERFPATPIEAMSALTGEGFHQWWKQVQQGPTAGQRSLRSDPAGDQAAEESLGWLNATIRLAAPQPFDAVQMAAEFLAEVRHHCARTLASIGHIKLLLEAGTQAARLNLTSTTGQIDTHGELPPTGAALLTVNARVELRHDELEAAVARALRKVCNEHGVTPEVQRVQSLQPNRAPNTVQFDRPE